MPHVYSGWRFDTAPFRSRLFKHYVSLRDYPFSRYPPYVSAGAVLLTWRTLVAFTLASRYAQPYPFDDVYLAILARLLRITPHHDERFEFWSRAYSQHAFEHVIAAHGFNDARLLRQAYADFNA